MHRRTINGLSVQDRQAVRRSQLVLDTPERRVVRFAVSNGRVYYATQTDTTENQPAPFDAESVTIERVAIHSGALERLPSLDASWWWSLTPEHWEHFAARDDHAFWVSADELIAVDFSAPEVNIQRYSIGQFGCTSFAVQGKYAYCARGLAGYKRIDLGAP